MGLFGTLLKTGFDIITLPVDVVKDVVTMGGTITEEPSAIGKKFDRLVDDMEEIRDSLDDI